MDLNRSNVRQIMRLIAFTLILYWALQNYAYLGSFLSYVLRVIRPFLIGGIIAFILNVPLRAIEGRILPELHQSTSKKAHGVRRALSLILTVLLFLSIISLILILVVPELINSISSLAQKLPGFLESLSQWAQTRLSGFPPLARVFNNGSMDLENLSSAAAAWIQARAGSLLSSTATWVTSFLTSLYSIFISLVVALFILARKEVLGRQVRNVLQAYLPKVWANRVVSLSNLFGETFSCFISGALTEASIMGVLFLISMTLFRMPYAVLISVLATITDLIPMIGPFIGCVIGIFLILVINPIQAFWFLLLFLALQQIEQNLIYPRVVGTSVGLPGLWVLVAVTVGGSVLGVTGIFLSIPFFSVLYTLLQKSVRRRLLAQREANAALSEAEAMETDDL